MRRNVSTVLALGLLIASSAQAEVISCRGSITSIQGEGLVARTHRFDVFDVTGNDLEVIIDKCSKIAGEKQNRAAARNPGGSFRPYSDLDLQCVRGGEKFAVRRSIKTAH